MKQTNQHIRILLMFLLLSLILILPVGAANRVHEIAVDVTLEADGAASIVQTWNGNFEEGTECYFPLTNLDGMRLYDLKVTDAQGEYQSLERWNTDASFEEKARHAGLNPVKGGYEICWGISDYGKNRYAVEYRLDGFTAAYEDFDGFLVQFVPRDMNSGPTDVTVRIHTQDGRPLASENAAIWAFGFEGQIQFSEDGVLAYTEQPLENDNSVIVLLRLNKGLLRPTRTVDASFADLQTRAFEGSDYQEDKVSPLWLLLIPAIVLLVALLVFLAGKEARAVKKLSKEADYWRQIPLNGDIDASFVLAKRFYQCKDEGNIVAAALMKLLSAGCLEPLQASEAGVWGREKKSQSLRLRNAPSLENSLSARLLYGVLEQAVGEDGILQETELEHYCKTHHTALMDIVRETQKEGTEHLTKMGCYQADPHSDGFKGLSERGRGLLLQLLGFRKYLLDFSLIAERGLHEALIWQDFLSFAALFGIAEQVLHELRKLYPAVHPQLQEAEWSYLTVYHYHHLTYGVAKAAETAETLRLSGNGGSSSVGGGGGFSGGGSGGGTR